MHVKSCLTSIFHTKVSNYALSSYQEIIQGKEIFLELLFLKVPVNRGKRKLWVREDTAGNYCHNLLCRYINWDLLWENAKLERHYGLEESGGLQPPKVGNNEHFGKG